MSYTVDTTGAEETISASELVRGDYFALPGEAVPNLVFSHWSGNPYMRQAVNLVQFHSWAVGPSDRVVRLYPTGPMTLGLERPQKDT
jgi:hypothetical protein